MALRKIRAGVVGAGRMGERHCRGYASLSDVDFVGLADVAPERVSAVAGKYGVLGFSSYHDLLDRVDAVTIATPTAAHHDIVLECLRRGIHVLVEKPLASSLQQAYQLVRQARLSSVVLQVGHIERFNPAFLELQSIVSDLEIVALNARRLSPFDTSNVEIDVVYDLMIHDIDIALTLLGRDVDSVQAHGRSRRSGGTDHAIASISIADGPVASLTASRLTEQKVRLIEVTALGAYIEADLLNKSVCIYRRTVPEYLTNHQRPLRYRQENLVERIHIPTAEPLMLELADFIRCVREQAAPRVSADDGLRAMELADEIRQRIASGNWHERGASTVPEKSAPMTVP